MATIKIRRGTAAELTASGVVFALSELGYCTDTKQIYIGNGISNTEITANKVSIEALGIDADSLSGTLPDVRLPTRLGTAGKTITDWNSAKENGWYMGYSISNSPTQLSSTWTMGYVQAHNTLYNTQIVHGFASDSPSNTLTYRRDLENGSWNGWERVLQSETELDERYGTDGLVYTAINSNTTLVAGKLYAVDTSFPTSNLTLTLPLSPTIGDTVGVVDIIGSFNSYSATLGRNGEKIMGLSTDLVLDTANKSIKLTYSGSVYGWRIINETPEDAVTPTGVPVGTIVAWHGGYFTNSSNGGFTLVLGSANTVAGANAYLNASGWYVCDGTALAVAGSPIWSDTGRYLPNLTDDRFIMGDTALGSTGGSSTMSHTHTYAAHTHTISNHVHTTAGKVLTIANLASHRHTSPAIAAQAGTGNYSYFNYLYSYPTWNDQTLYSAYTGSGSSHTHGNTGNPTTNPNSGSASTTTSSEASNTENRPKFLSCFYIIKATV